MKIDVRRYLAPVLAVLILMLTVQQTLSALKISGTWRRNNADTRQKTADPYGRLEGVLALPATEVAVEGLRNPFAFGSARAPERAPTQTVRPVDTPPAPAPAPRPVLTSIVMSDSDPRATVRYDGRDYSVRVNGLFSDFTVRSITENQVTLEKNTGESITLTLKARGE